MGRSANLTKGHSCIPGSGIPSDRSRLHKIVCKKGLTGLHDTSL